MRPHILALDLGTATGFAWGSAAPELGTWKLATDKEIAAEGRNRMRRRRDIRAARLRAFMRGLLPCPDIIIFEDVEFASSTYQVQLWASFRGVVWTAFDEADHILYECVPVGTLKKFATGSGNASKDDMARMLYHRAPKLKALGLDDNAVDAAWLWLWASEKIKI